MKVAIGPSSFAAKDTTPLKMLEEAGIEVKPNPYGRRLTEEEIIDHISEVDGLIAGLEPLNKKVLNSASTLKAIARVGVGMDNVDQVAAEELKIKVSNTPDGPTQAVAELTVACMIALLRNIPAMNRAMQSKKWEKQIGTGLNDLEILLIGYGRIGKMVSKMLQPFKPQIMVYDPEVQASDLQFAEKVVNLEDGLQKAKVISLHAGGCNTILNEQTFDLMQDGVILLNSARAELVDEQSLLNALDNGKIASAWFDVFWQEPYEGKLSSYPNVMLTPHIATYTNQCRLGMETGAVENILRDLGVR